jgi:hypothetical protein
MRIFDQSMGEIQQIPTQPGAPRLRVDVVTASALRLEIFLRYLAEFCIPPSVCKFHRQDAIFQQNEFCRQIASVPNITEVTQNIPISINAVVSLFDWRQSSLKLPLEHVLKSAGYRGKQTAVEQNREQQIRDWI